MGLTERVPPIVRSVVEEAREENIPLLAAGIAYNAFVSLLPLLLLLLFVSAAVGNDTLSEQVVELTGGVLASGTEELVADALRNASARAGASLVGVVTLLWGSLKIFRGMDTAFSEIYDTGPSDSFVDQLKDGLLVLSALGIAVAAAVAAGAVFALFEHVPFVGLLGPLVLVGGLALAFFPIYYVFPDVDLSTREVVPGVLVAAVGWTALEALFQVYVVFADKQAVYGAIGGVLLLLTWLYFGGLVLLGGAVVNAVLADRTGGAAASGRTRGAAGAPARREGDDGEDEHGHEDEEADQRYERLQAAHERLERDHADLRADHRALQGTYADLRRDHERLRRQLARARTPLWARVVRILLRQR